MKKSIIISAIDLVGIAIAARLWFKEKNEICNAFKIEEIKAKRLRDKLWEADWEGKLFIDEMPF